MSDWREDAGVLSWLDDARHERYRETERAMEAAVAARDRELRAKIEAAAIRRYNHTHSGFTLPAGHAESVALRDIAWVLDILRS